MTSESERPATNCPLPESEQRRNLMLYAACTGLVYLAAPVLYVGVTQATLCKFLEADTRAANLPATLFFAMTAMPALFAVLSPQVRHLRRNLSLCFLVCGVMLAATSFALYLRLPSAVLVALIILQGGVSGATMPTAIALLWEVLGRGTDDARRGVALSLAFGGGPILATLGSLAQSFLLGGEFFGKQLAGWDYPGNFVVLFGAAAPAMFLAAGLAWCFTIPLPLHEPARRPLSEVRSLLIGLPCLFATVPLLYAASLVTGTSLTVESSLATVESGDVLSFVLRCVAYLAGAVAAIAITFHFRALLRQRTFLIATVVTILVYAGNMIPSNLSLYAREALDADPVRYAGPQNMLRFGCKAIAGLLLGGLLVKTNPRAALLAAALVYLVAPLWAANVRGPAYLVAFGIFGAGELIGVYAPNYLVSASRPDDLRNNMAFMTMLMVPAAPFGYLYGAIVDWAASPQSKWVGVTSRAMGFRLSFFVCAAAILSGILLAYFKLPKHPRPE